MEEVRGAAKVAIWLNPAQISYSWMDVKPEKRGPASLCTNVDGIGVLDAQIHDPTSEILAGEEVKKRMSNSGSMLEIEGKIMFYC